MFGAVYNCSGRRKCNLSKNKRKGEKIKVKGNTYVTVHRFSRTFFEEKVQKKNISFIKTRAKSLQIYSLVIVTERPSCTLVEWYHQLVLTNITSPKLQRNIIFLEYEIFFLFYFFNLTWVHCCTHNIITGPITFRRWFKRPRFNAFKLNYINLLESICNLARIGTP